MSNIKVTQDQIQDIIANSEIKVWTMYDKVTMVVCKLPNGFVLSQSSGAVDKENYDEVIGYETCMNKIINEVWKLEGYALQKKVYEDGLN